MQKTQRKSRCCHASEASLLFHFLITDRHRKRHHHTPVHAAHAYFSSSRYGESSLLRKLVHTINLQQSSFQFLYKQHLQAVAMAPEAHSSPSLMQHGHGLGGRCNGDGTEGASSPCNNDNSSATDVPVLLRIIEDELCPSFLDDYYCFENVKGPDEARMPLRENMAFFDSSDEATTVDVSKLIADDSPAGSTANQSGTAAEKSAAMAAAFPKSILSRRGPHDDPTKKAPSRSKSSRSIITFTAASPGNGEKQPHNNPMPSSKTGKKGSTRRFFSQPIPTITKLSAETNRAKATSRSGPIPSESRLQDSDASKKGNYVLFQTKSNKQLSHLLSKKIQDDSCRPSHSYGNSQTGRAMPAGRYFDALKGPELETLKDCEEPLLPLDQKWPFLLRFPIGCFGICLGLGSQTILWKTLATSASVQFLRIPLGINLFLWYFAFCTLFAISAVYATKCFFYFEAVKREYYHPVRVNFFFAPWIASMFLTLGVPPSVARTIHPAVWCIWTAPILVLELKIYGQWLSGGARRLSKVANPSTHLSLVGNFISSLLASAVGWKEAALFFWAVGSAHYLVVFVTLYQRLPTCEVLTKELHPVFFLFVAAPSAASVAWKSIKDGEFDYVSRMPYFLALFLYASLVVRLNFFYGFKFSLTWWAYTFPMTAAAIATIHYSLEVRHPITQAMAAMLSLISSAVVFCLFVTTVVHAVTGRLFQNDLAIAIATRRCKRKQKGSWKAGQEEECKRGNSEEVVLEKEGAVIVAALRNGHVSVECEGRAGEDRIQARV